MLGNLEPEIVGGVLRARVAPAIAEPVVKTQWGDGCGARSFELARLALEAVAALGSADGLSTIRLFIDVLQAFFRRFWCSLRSRFQNCWAQRGRS